MKKIPVWLKGVLIGFITSIILAVLNIALSGSLFTPDFFGLIPCNATCWAYWKPITLLEISIVFMLIGSIVGKMISK